MLRGKAITAALWMNIPGHIHFQMYMFSCGHAEAVIYRPHNGYHTIVQYEHDALHCP